jgi:putative FmdB family regulatory protein
MPIYQFICKHCHKYFETILSYKDYGETVVSCPFCQSQNIQRKIKNIRVNSSENSADSFPDNPSVFLTLESDPQSMGKMMRKMGEQTGEKFEPEFNEVVDRLERGQTFQQIEKELPDINPPSDSLD